MRRRWLTIACLSRGQTRKIVGDDDQGHTDKDGEFDSSHIVMKRWADFERDRRYRSGSHSRDSTYDNLVQRSGSPQRPASNRYSVVSSADTYTSGTHGSGSTSDAALFRRGSPGPETVPHSSGPRRPQQLELPAPLSSQGGHSSTPESLESLDSNPDLHAQAFGDPAADQRHLAHIMGSSPSQPQSVEYPHYPEYDSDEIEHEQILRESPGLTATSAFDTAAVPVRAYAHDREPVYSTEPEVMADTGRQRTQTPEHARSESTSSNASNPFSNAHRRGVSLVDAGPVPGSQGFRVVQRQRRSSQGPGTPGLPSSSRSRNSLAPADLAALPASPPLSSDGFASISSASGTTSPSLPPGAAPARRHS